MSKVNIKCLACGATGDISRRYECVTCGPAVTYCGICFDKCKTRTTKDHKYYHLMKAVYNEATIDLYFFVGGAVTDNEIPQIYDCPMCKETEMNATQLKYHVLDKHIDHPDVLDLLTIVCELLGEDAPTEIRCQEKSRGGLSYEVILAEPAPNVAVPKRPVSLGKSMSAEEIEQKLKAAEERRVSLEAKKMADISTKLAKVEEATRKKDEITNEFITQTKEQLETKMEQVVEKRESIITDMKEKLKIHAQEIEKTRESLEQQKINEQKAIEEKLKIAQSLRDENIKKMLYRLKEHNTIKIAEMKSQNDHLECQKLEEKARVIENKLYAAEQKREKELQKKIEKVQKLERRAEIVRQNKAQTMNIQGEDIDGQQNAIPSSG